MPTHPDPSQYWWVGVDTDRQLMLTGWIGETPEGDAPYLLLYPSGMGAAARMRQLADVLGLQPGNAGPPQPTVEASATTSGDRLVLHLPGQDITIPIHADYAATTTRGWGVLVVGQDGWDGHHGPSLDRYLARRGFSRIHYGRILINPEGPPR
ncbi:hypothetical protein [Nocardia farcinica]|uniref:hypothetical protein n=1 Tax=Nocardia farcinica TaxID=37329 RepID=UPI00245818AA|nr:hypothetical protein [Nocardia farcinica]